MHIGIAGEVRCVVTKADGTVKEDTGFQKNLILNQGLEFFGGNKGNSFNSRCAIGSGNSEPTASQTSLDSFVSISDKVNTDNVYDYSYTDSGDGLYKVSMQSKYRFTSLTSVNISEVGLVSYGSAQSNYYLTTRALIKDSSGQPTSISVKTGEILDIYYRFYKVVETTDKNYTVNLINALGDTTPYNVVVRPAYVGSTTWKQIDEYLSVGHRGIIHYSANELSSITGSISSNELKDVATLGPYEANTYKRILYVNFSLNDAVGNVRTISSKNSLTLGFTFFPYQIRFGRLSDDAPITKTHQEILTIPLEFSWGRYEGEL